MMEILEKKTNYKIIKNEECGKIVISLYSYGTRICDYIVNPGLGFDYLYRFGKCYDYSKTTMKHLYNFLENYTFSNFGRKKQNIEKSIKNGFLFPHQNIPVIYDKTMY